jgi:hypothetical protein
MCNRLDQLSSEEAQTMLEAYQADKSWASKGPARISKPQELRAGRLVLELYPKEVIRTACRWDPMGFSHSTWFHPSIARAAPSGAAGGKKQAHAARSSTCMQPASHTTPEAPNNRPSIAVTCLRFQLALTIALQPPLAAHSPLPSCALISTSTTCTPRTIPCTSSARLHALL